MKLSKLLTAAVLLIIVLIIAGFFIIRHLGYSQVGEKVSTALSTIAKQNSSKNLNKYSQAFLAKPAEIKVSELLLSGHGMPLFEKLFNEKILLKEKHFSGEIEQSLNRRFNQPYPNVQDEAQHELTNRLGILKAMAAAYQSNGDKTEQNNLMTFYKALVFRNSEQFLVRRQALQNLSAWTRFLSEKERSEILANTPQPLLATASKSEKELLEEIFNEK